MKKYIKYLIITLLSVTFFTGCTEEQTTQFVSNNTTTTEEVKEYKSVDSSSLSNIELHYKEEGVQTSFNIGMSIDVKIDASSTQDNDTQFSYDDRNVILTTSEIAAKLEKGNIDPDTLELFSGDIFFLGKYSFEDLTTTTKTFKQRFVIPNEIQRLYKINTSTKYKIVLSKDDGGRMVNISSSSEFSLENKIKGEIEISEFKTGLSGTNFAVIDAQYSELYNALKPYIQTNYPQYIDKFDELNNENNTGTEYCQSAHLATTFRFNQYSNIYSNISYESKIQFQIGNDWIDAKIDTTTVKSSGTISGVDHSEKLTTIPVCIPKDKLTTLFDDYIKQLEAKDSVGSVTLKIPVKVVIDSKGDSTQLAQTFKSTTLEIAFTVPTGFKARAYLAKTPLVQDAKDKKSISKSVINRTGSIDAQSYDKKVGLDFAGVGMRTLYDSTYSDTSTTSNTHVYANFEHKIYAYAGGSEIPLHSRQYTVHSYANDIRKNAFSVDGFSPFGQLSYSRMFASCKNGEYVSDICAFTNLKLEDKFTLEVTSDVKRKDSKTSFSDGNPEFGYSTSVGVSYFGNLNYNDDGTFNATPFTFNSSFTPNLNFLDDIKKLKSSLGKGSKAVGGSLLKFVIGITASIGSDLDATNIDRVQLKGNFLYASAAVWAKAGLNIDAFVLNIFAGAYGEVELARVNFGHDLSIIYSLDNQKHFDMIVSDVYSGLELNFIKGKLALFVEVMMNLGLFEVSSYNEFVIIETPYLVTIKQDFIKQRKGIKFTYNSDATPTKIDNPIYNNMDVSSEVKIDKEIFSNNKQFKLYFDATNRVFKVVDIKTGIAVTNIFNGINATHVKLFSDGTLRAYINDTTIGAIECSGSSSSKYMLVLRDDGRVQIFNGTSSNPGSVACDSLIFANDNLVTSSIGTPSASSQWDDGWAAAKAFDGILYDNAHGNAWMSQNSKVINEYLSYSFNESKVVNAYKIYPRAGSINDDGIVQALSSWELQANNNGSWVTLDTVSGQTNWLEKQGRAFGFPNNTAYKDYRILIKGNNENNSGAVSIGELELYNITPRDSVVVTNGSEYVRVNSILSQNDTSVVDATSSHNNDAWGSWRAFDGKLEDWAWHSNATGAYNLPQALQYKFNKPTIVNSYTIYARKYADTISQAPKSWDFQGSYDGINWITLHSESNQTNWTRGQGRTFSFNTGISYVYYRINVKESNGAGSYTSISELVLQNKGENYRTLSFEDESIVKANVQIDNNGWGAWRAFDGKIDDTAWHSNTNVAMPHTLQYRYLEPTIVNSYKIYARSYGDNITQAPNTWTFEGSNDGENWSVLHSVSGQSNWTRGEGREFNFNLNTPHLFYRISVSKSNGAGNYTSISELKFMQKDVVDVASDTLVPGEVINSFYKLTSPNKRFELKVENNRLVIYQKDVDAIIWRSTRDVANGEFTIDGATLKNHIVESINTQYSDSLKLTFYGYYEDTNKKPYKYMSFDANNQYYMTIRDDGIVDIYEGSKFDSATDTLKLSFGNKVAQFSGAIAWETMPTSSQNQFILNPGDQVFSKSLEYFLQIGKKGEFNIYKYEKIPSYIDDLSQIYKQSDTSYRLISSVNPNLSNFMGYSITDRTIHILDNDYKKTTQELNHIDGMNNIYGYKQTPLPVYVELSDEGKLSIYTKDTDSGIDYMIYNPNYFEVDRNSINPGYDLFKGDYIVSDNGVYKLLLDESGSLKLINQDENKVVWEPIIPSNINQDSFGISYKGASTFTIKFGDYEVTRYNRAFNIVVQNNGMIDVFDRWGTYLGSLNSPDYKLDYQESTQNLNLLSKNKRYILGNQYSQDDLVIYDLKEKRIVQNIYSLNDNTSYDDRITAISLESTGIYLKPHGQVYNEGKVAQGYSVYQEVADKYASLYGKTIEIDGLDNYDYKNLVLGNEGALEVYGLKDVNSQREKIWSSDGLFVHYTFDETHKNFMPSGDTTSYGTPSYKGGVYNNSINLDGVDDYIDLPDITMADEYTISVWVKNSASNLNNDRIIDIGTGKYSSNIALTFKSGCTGLALYLTGEGKNLDATVECGVWNHIVATVDNTGLAKIYVNGELKTQAQGVNAGERTFTSNYIGKSNWNDPLAKMQIDDLRIYDNAIDSKKILSMYKTGLDYLNGLEGMSTHLKFDNNTLDTSGTKDATPIGEPIFVGGMQNNAISLDGVDDYLELPTIKLSKSFSFSTWVKNSANLNWDRIVDLGYGVSDTRITLSYHDGCGGVSLYLKDEGLHLTTTVECGKWNHIAGTVDSSGLAKLYVNGVLKVQNQGKAQDERTFTSNYIGKSNYAHNPLAKMQIDDFRIYEYDLSATQIKNIYEYNNETSKFDFEDNTHDTNGALTGQSIGSIAYTYGIDGKALNLDGDDDYVDVSDITFGKEYTISAWAYNDDASKSWARVFDFGNGQGADNILLAFPGTTCSQVDFADHTSGIFNTFEAASLDVECGVWNHYTVSMDITGLAKVYINGELRLEVQGQVRSSKTLTSNYIGKSNWSWDSMSKMKVDNLKIHHVALLDDKIKELYKKEVILASYEFNDSMTDYINGKDGTLNGEMEFVEDIQRVSIALDGNDDYVTLPNLTFGAEYTVSTWINNSAYDISNAKVYDLGTGANSSWMNLSFEYGCSELSYFDKAIGNKYLRASISCGEWTHVVTTVDSNGLAKLYINGTLKDTIQGSGKGFTTFTSNYIGKSNTSNQPLANMKIDKMEIYKKAMSESEIIELYNKDK